MIKCSEFECEINIIELFERIKEDASKSYNYCQGSTVWENIFGVVGSAIQENNLPWKSRMMVDKTCVKNLRVWEFLNQRTKEMTAKFWGKNYNISKLLERLMLAVHFIHEHIEIVGKCFIRVFPLDCLISPIN